MKQFEYTVDAIWTNDPLEVKKYLDEWGLKGWECFYIEVNNNLIDKYRNIFLKKEIKNE